jgi:hypothetical protein
VADALVDADELNVLPFDEVDESSWEVSENVSWVMLAVAEEPLSGF